MDSADISDASQLVVSQGDLSFAWVNGDLLAASVSGRLANELRPGDAICTAIPALFGLEDRIGALRQSPDDLIELPNIRTFGPQGAGARLNYVVRWSPDRQQFLLCVSRPLAIDEGVIELQREARRRRLAEEQLLRQAEDIKEANKALSDANAGLSEFTRIISHDLKAPMRAMRYLAEDLEAALQVASNSDALAHIDRLKAQSRRMSAMITGLLQYSRMGSDAEDPATMACVNVTELASDIIQSLPRPEGLRISVDAGVPTLRAQKDLLDLVMRNLIENAIKHHDREEGHIRIETREDGDDVLVIIADDGPGIAKDLQEAVFRPFTQLDPDVEGTGLGLTLVTRAAEVAGASLTLDSEPDCQRGSRFILRLPGKTMLK